MQSTGTPTVVVLINGRALAVRWIAQNVPAVVEAWLPGERGGTAVAEVLFGDNESERKALGDDSPPRRPVAGLLQLQEIQAGLARAKMDAAMSTWTPSRSIPSATG